MAFASPPPSVRVHSTRIRESSSGIPLSTSSRSVSSCRLVGLAATGASFAHPGDTTTIAALTGVEAGLIASGRVTLFTRSHPRAAAIAPEASPSVRSSSHDRQRRPLPRHLARRTSNGRVDRARLDLMPLLAPQVIRIILLP